MFSWLLHRSKLLTGRTLVREIKLLSQQNSLFYAKTYFHWQVQITKGPHLHHMAQPVSSPEILELHGFMMTSSNGNIIRVTGPLCGEFTGLEGQWRGASMFSLICVWINGWINNREAGDLRRHRGHYDVNVMCIGYWTSWPENPRISNVG